MPNTQNVWMQQQMIRKDPANKLLFFRETVQDNPKTLSDILRQIMENTGEHFQITNIEHAWIGTHGKRKITSKNIMDLS